MDETLKIMDLNNAYCRMVGYSRNELIGKSLLNMVTKDYRQFFSAKREDLLNREKDESKTAIYTLRKELPS